MTNNAPATPRPASSVLLVRGSPLEVLMVRRSDQGAFSSALVFPGGTVCDDDRSDDWRPLLHGAEGLDDAERALRIAGLRETYEEVGILLLVNSRGAEVPPQPSDPSSPFIEVVRQSGGLLPLQKLVPFAHWITPESAPKRFDTHFYVLASPPGQSGTCDGHETVALEWQAPAAVVSAEAGLPFPTRLNLMRLAESDAVESALDMARARAPFTILPKVEKRDDGVYVVIPAEAGYPILENRRPGGRLN